MHTLDVCGCLGASLVLITQFPHDYPCIIFEYLICRQKDKISAKTMGNPRIIFQQRHPGVSVTIERRLHHAPQSFLPSHSSHRLSTGMLPRRPPREARPHGADSCWRGRWSGVGLWEWVGGWVSEWVSGVCGACGVVVGTTEQVSTIWELLMLCIRSDRIPSRIAHVGPPFQGHWQLAIRTWPPQHLGETRANDTGRDAVDADAFVAKLVC